MEYNYRNDYKHIFDTPAKMEQESVIVNKIMDLLNKNKYDNINEFIKKNPSYQDFLKKNELENVVKHFGNTLSEEDYRLIQQQMLKITNLKNSFDSENIKTTNIDEKEYNSYKGKEKTFFLNNTNSNMSIERQIQELQQTSRDFQTTDITKNTNKLMQELEQNTKESLNLTQLNEINTNQLNEEEKKLVEKANDYELSTDSPFRIDLNNSLMVDKNDEIMQIQNNNGDIAIYNDTGVTKGNLEIEANKNNKTFQKTLTPNPNSIYSANNN